MKKTEQRSEKQKRDNDMVDQRKRFEVERVREQKPRTIGVMH